MSRECDISHIAEGVTEIFSNLRRISQNIWNTIRIFVAYASENITRTFLFVIFLEISADILKV